MLPYGDILRYPAICDGLTRQESPDDERQQRSRLSLTSVIGLVMAVCGGLWLWLVFDPVGIEGNPSDNPVWAYGAVLIGLMLAGVGTIDT